MLLAFRRFGQTTTVKYGLILLALSFITWGIGDYLNGSNDSTAVKVGSGEISVNELYQAYQQRKNQFSQMTGETISDDMAMQMGLPNLIISEMVREKLIHNAAVELGITGSDMSIARTIQSMNAFQQDGAFSADLYRQQLQLAGTKATAFEESLKDEQQQNLVRSFFRPQAGAAWGAQQATFANSTVDLTVWPVRARDLPKLSAPTEAELNEFYVARTAQYQTPEARDLTKLTLTQADFVPADAPSSAAIEAYYQDNAAVFMLPERRTVQQATFLSEAEAATARAQLVAGETLPNTVDLGAVTRDDLPTAFANVVFGLELNDYSTPQETPLGYAVAWVSEIQPAVQQPLADVRVDIIELLQADAALEAFEDALATVEDAAASGVPLSQIATEVNITPEILTGVEFTTDVLDTEQLATAFELRAGEVSSALEDDAGAMTFIEVTSITPPTLPALSTQLDRVLTDFTAVRNQERVRAAVTNIRQAIAAGETPQAAYAAAQVTVRPTRLRGQTPADIQQLGWSTNVQQQLLTLDDGALLDQNVQYQENLGLVQLDARTVGDITPELQTAAETQLNKQLRDELFLAYLTAQEEQQKIKLYDSRLEQVFRHDSQ